MKQTRVLLAIVIAFGTFACILLSGRAPTECNCESPILIKTIQGEYPRNEHPRNEVTNKPHVEVTAKNNHAITNVITSKIQNIPSIEESEVEKISKPMNKLQNYFLDLWTSVIKSEKSIPEDLLVDIIKNVFIDNPVYPQLPYNFNSKNPSVDGQIGVPPIVDKILGGKTEGFFIESGAYEGETFSNSLLFELKRNYTGLLIEPSRDYERLMKKNRKAKSLNVCLATKTVPHVVDFYNYDMIGGIKGQISGWAKSEVNSKAKVIKVTCLPLYTILLSVGNPTVDFFSLDVEGAELEILKTIPWDKVNINVLAIEVGGNGRGFQEIDDLLKHANYTKVMHMISGQDNIYVHNNWRSPVFGSDQKPKLMEKIPL